MIYTETIFFIGKCLTLSSYPEYIPEVRKKIHSGTVIWEEVVWISTSELVFPALYLNLKRAGLLSELPDDLVDYMVEFTDKNRDNNFEIIAQAQEIAKLLNTENISPIFLKGTAHLLDGLYEDSGERMVGDIDLVVEEKDMVNSAEILIRNGYTPLAVYDPDNFAKTKHYPRLANTEKTAAVEVHRQILEYPRDKALPNQLMLENRKILAWPESSFVLKDEYQIIHNLTNYQLNDEGYYFGTFSLRQMYDLLLLSKRANPLSVISNFGHFYGAINSNLALSHLFLAHAACIPYQRNWQSRFFLWRVKQNMAHRGWARFSRVLLYLAQRFGNAAKQLIEAIYKPSMRRSICARLTNPHWYQQYFDSLGKALKNQ